MCITRKVFYNKNMRTINLAYYFSLASIFRIIIALLRIPGLVKYQLSYPLMPNPSVLLSDYSFSLGLEGDIFKGFPCFFFILVYLQSYVISI